MKEILILSGKGGTGKTSITSAIASLAKKSVFVDCDVDAADLHLILAPEVVQSNDFISGHQAKIRQDDCIGCGRCEQVCRFEAMKQNENGKYSVDPVACEGCGVCVWNCPVNAIDFDDSLCGKYFVSNTRFGTMVHARLDIAAENSGKLVSVVRQNAREIANENDNDYIIIDGPPGIGCPVIASMTGTDAVLIVTEPTLSGLHDMERVIDLTKHFGIKTYVCINKYSINDDITKKIEDRLDELGIPLIGRVPYDRTITEAQIHKQSIIEFANNDTSDIIKNMWLDLVSKLK